ncbi:MAG: serine/threonine protein kinase [Deltaproteobacteria bacterium]|nr:serine/threonine protein kinase [Deltaproteobacteria bacterium]
MQPAPAIFGRYELLDKLGEGGMAEVFKARLRGGAGIDKLLVIKRILPQVSSDPEFIRLFVNEAKIALPLTHGNITSTFEFGDVEGQFFLAMEYIHGQDLATVMHRCGEARVRMPVEAALYVASEVAKGLNYAHSYISPTGGRIQVVHLDVSPQNVLISYDGAVKLTDFGIASLLRRPDADGKIRGKACYLAPEQAMGKDVDGRTDIFALGTVLYEALTGVRPFDAPEDLAAVAKVVKAEAPPPSQYRPGMPVTVEEVIMKALHREPHFRYERAADFQVALSQLMFQIAPSYTAQDLAEWMREMFAWEIVEQLPEAQRAGMRDRLLFQFAQARVEVDAESQTYEDLLKMGTVSIPAAGAGMMAAPDGSQAYALRHGGSGGPVVAPSSGVLARLSPLKRVLLGGAAVTLLVAAFAAVPIIKGGGSTPPVTTGAAASQPVEPDEFIDDDEPLNGTGPAATGPTGATGANKRATPTPAPAPVKRRAGYLSCNSWPWSVVYLDKRRLPGNTPLSRVRVPEGNHRLRFVNPELGLAKEVPVTIVAGAEKTVAVKLDR